MIPSLTFVFGVCSAVGLSVYAVDDLTVLMQEKVIRDPSLDQNAMDELDLSDAEEEITRSNEEKAEEKAEEAKAMLEDAAGAAGAEIEAMQAELETEGTQAAGEEEEEDANATVDMSPEDAKQAFKARIAERARLAAANHYSFTVGSTVFVNKRKARISWDGRPDHEFVKVTWLDNGKISSVIPVEDVSLEKDAVVEVASGRHLHKEVSVSMAEEKKRKLKKVMQVTKDTTRRRRGVLRRMAYGIKKLPMVMSLPFRGIQDEIQDFTDEMTESTGLTFNGTLMDLLESSTKPKAEELLWDDTEADEAEALALGLEPKQKRKNFTEIMRNRTVRAALSMNKAYVEPLMSQFTSDMRMPDSELAGVVKQKNLKAAAVALQEEEEEDSED